MMNPAHEHSPGSLTLLRAIAQAPWLLLATLASTLSLFTLSMCWYHSHSTGDMIRRCRDAGLREPKFEMADGFTLTLWRTKDSSAGTAPSGKTSGKTSVAMSGKMSGKIVRLMLEKPDITIPEIAQRLKRTPRAIEMQINRLKADESIGRIGPAKGGHWEVLQ